MNAHDRVRACITDSVLQQRLAKYMVMDCFRNSMLEDLHAGISPSSAAGDYSDVMVSSPYGVIPWNQVSRLNDDEMKRLMIDVVDRTYRFIHMLFDETTPAVNSCFSLQSMTPSPGGTLQGYEPQRSNRSNWAELGCLAAATGLTFPVGSSFTVTNGMIAGLPGVLLLDFTGLSAPPEFKRGRARDFLRHGVVMPPDASHQRYERRDDREGDPCAFGELRVDLQLI